ncbi:iron complex outermembrane receptor protein [Novosphingobium sp. SG751A]|uniref:TonB-dependent receptor plug domain-containing protein n=1 Tax=Novosphingobium sp. SG751A TaxID=2587000 RepID=UPI001553DC6F|nr:TonB-dependent receptor [Novosphingobium sp. SG751A]NOW47968.1 iron complex outermembrane receptor protein [Novosphingobium sp. SG751A]
MSGAVFAQEQAATVSDNVSAAEIIVTGTSIRGVAPTGSPILSVGADDIKKSNASSLSDVLAKVPQVAQFGTIPTGSPTFGSIVAATSLRPNLGNNATLLLINGHRVVPSGILTGIVDASIITPGAIDRVEIIPDGASSIYGSDAVAGVINFITRKKGDGMETSARYTTASKFNTFDLSQRIGTSWSSGSFVVAASYTESSRLRGSDRDYYNALNTNNNSSQCGIAQFGAAPLCDTTNLADIQPRKRRGSIFATLRQDLAPTVELWSDLLYSKETRDSQEFQPSLSFPMAAANPYNTSGVTQTLAYRPTTEFGDGLQRHVSMEAMQASVGLNAKLPRDFGLNMFATAGQTNNNAFGQSLDNVAYRNALAATTTATAFDPFGHRTSSAVLSQIADGNEVVHSRQRLYEIGAKVDGPLFGLPGGDVRVAVGTDFIWQSQVGSRRVGSPNSVLDSTGTLTGYLSRGDGSASRNIKSAYAELFVPVVGSGNEFALAKKLSLSLAARVDDYSDVGSTFNPKIGADWKPVDAIRIFGNYSTAFQAPSLGDTTSGAVDTRLQLSSAGSPNFPPSGNPTLNQYTSLPGLIVAGGSPNLRPQTSKNYSFGFDFKPQAWSGFKASATYYHVDFKDFIGIPFNGPGSTFSNPAFAQYGILAPIVGGVIQPFTPSSPEVTKYSSVLAVDGGIIPSQVYWIAVLQRVNVSRKIQSGIDYDVSKPFALGKGTLTVRAAGTYILTDKLQGAAGAPITDIVATDSRSRFMGSVDYDTDRFTLGATVMDLSGFYTTIAQTAYVSHFATVNRKRAKPCTCSLISS